MEDLEARTDVPSPRAPVEEGLDRLSLIQALRDFEVANGRVIDLTERLVVTADELLAARQDLDAVRAERDDLRARLDHLTARHEELRETHARTLERKSVKLGQAIWEARRSIPLPRRGG
jgi:uncharacterized coiled-coil DUF342 family protein